MNRTEVYKVIDTERDYQDKLQQENNWEHRGHPSVTEELVMMQEYLNRSRTAWVTNQGDDESLDMLRKVVGIGIRCFENHTVPVRDVSVSDVSTKPSDKKGGKLLNGIESKKLDVIMRECTHC